MVAARRHQTSDHGELVRARTVDPEDPRATSTGPQKSNTSHRRRDAYMIMVIVMVELDRRLVFTA